MSRINGFIFSKRSIENLSQVDSRLQAIAYLALRHTKIDFGITTGYRNRSDQEKAYRNHTSRVQYPNSFHNSIPSRAIDIVATPLGKVTFAEHYYYYLAGVFEYAAKEVQRNLKEDQVPFHFTWGGAWRHHVADFNSEEMLQDLCHYQIKNIEDKP